MAKEKREYTFAGTFPTGTHAMWMHYGLAVGKQVTQIDLYKSVASAMKINVPMDVMRTSKPIDGVVWDGKDPAK